MDRVAACGGTASGLGGLTLAVMSCRPEKLGSGADTEGSIPQAWTPGKD